jgi:hypothetical protein
MSGMYATGSSAVAANIGPCHGSAVAVDALNKPVVADHHAMTWLLLLLLLQDTLLQ